MRDLAFEQHPAGHAAVPTGENGSLAQDRPILGFRCTGRTRHIAVDLALAYCDRATSLPQSRAAVSVTVSSTGCTSAVERLMTLSTSLVAVWYSSASSRSALHSAS